MGTADARRVVQPRILKASRLEILDAPGGVLFGTTAPGRRSPLCDIADLLWSLHQATVMAATERDPAGRLGLASLGQAWEMRNRRALVSGYLGTPGIGGMIGADRDLVRNLVAFFELARSARPR